MLHTHIYKIPKKQNLATFMYTRIIYIYVMTQCNPLNMLGNYERAETTYTITRFTRVGKSTEAQTIENCNMF